MKSAECERIIAPGKSKLKAVIYYKPIPMFGRGHVLAT
jgi:hypothetical protein